MKFHKFATVLLLVPYIIIASCTGKDSVDEVKPPDKPGIFVSILPQRYFVRRIVGEDAQISVLVPKGKSPHSYEPTPKQVRDLSRAVLYFTIGVDFEYAFVPTIRKTLPQMEISDVSSGHNYDPEPDPHIWLSPDGAKTIARNMLDTLVGLGLWDEDMIKANYDSLLEDIDTLDADLQELLSPFAGQTLLVFHPSFGYFAGAYGLIQKAIESGGNEPTPQRLTALIEEARSINSRVIFVQSQFSSDSANAVAKALDGVVVRIDPLAEDWYGNMRQIGEEVHRGLQRGSD